MDQLNGATPSMLITYLKADNKELKDKVSNMQSKVVQNKFVTIGDIDIDE